MDIRQFEQFQMIAECGTMREAAERLFLSQPTLSYNLKKLESELGCKLFTRVHNQLRLTPYGEIVVKYSNLMTGQMNEMLDELAAQRRLEEGTVRIGCFSLMFSSFEMVQIAAALPDTRFEVRNVSSGELLEGLDGGRFHLVVMPGPVNKKGLVSERLYEERAFVSVPKESPVAELDSVGEAELQKLEFQIEAGLAGYGDWYRQILDDARVAGERIDTVAVHDHLRTKDLVPKANLITSFIMEYVRVSEGRAVIPIDLPRACRNVCMIWNERGFQQAKPVIEYVHANKERLLSGNAFFSYLMYPESKGNLHVIDE